MYIFGEIFGGNQEHKLQPEKKNTPTIVKYAYSNSVGCFLAY